LKKNDHFISSKKHPGPRPKGKKRNREDTRRIVKRDKGKKKPAIEPKRHPLSGEKGSEPASKGSMTPEAPQRGAVSISDKRLDKIQEEGK